MHYRTVTSILRPVSNPTSSRPYPTTPQTRFPESRTPRISSYPIGRYARPRALPPSASMMYLSPGLQFHDSPQKIIEYISSRQTQLDSRLVRYFYFLPCLEFKASPSNTSKASQPLHSTYEKRFIIRPSHLYTPPPPPTNAKMATPEVSIPQQHQACTYDHPGSISTAVATLDTPAPGPGELLVQLTHSGVCHSDLGVMENSVWWTPSFGVFFERGKRLCGRIRVFGVPCSVCRGQRKGKSSAGYSREGEGYV